MIIRERVVELLSTSGPSTSSEIAARLKVAKTSLQSELASLRQAGRIKVTPSGIGRGYLYTLKPAAVMGRDGRLAKTAAAMAAPKRATVERKPYERRSAPVLTTVQAMTDDSALRDMLNVRLAYHEAEVKRTKTMLDALR